MSEMGQLLEIVKALKASSDAHLKSNVLQMQSVIDELRLTKESMDGLRGRLTELTGLDGKEGTVKDIKGRLKQVESILPSPDKVDTITRDIEANQLAGVDRGKEIESLKQWRMYITGALVALGVALGVVLRVAKFK